MRVAQFVVARLQLLAQPREVAGGKQFQVVGDDFECEGARRRRFETQQLQLQALRCRTRADAGRIEAVQQRERRVQLVGIDFQFGGQVGEDLVECRTQIAVLVERFDQERDERTIARARLGDAQLGHQMVAQRRRRFVDLQRRHVVVV